MKGITPVIAVILLLLITVSLVGFAFVWFTRVSQTAAAGIENQTQKLITTKSIRIENAKVAGAITNIDVRNTGDAAILGTELTFYVEDVRVAANGCPASIAPGAVATCAPAVQCTATQRLRATIGSGTGDITTCK